MRLFSHFTQLTAFCIKKSEWDSTISVTHNEDLWQFQKAVYLMFLIREYLIILPCIIQFLLLMFLLSFCLRILHLLSLLFSFRF